MTSLPCSPPSGLAVDAPGVRRPRHLLGLHLAPPRIRPHDPVGPIQPGAPSELPFVHRPATHPTGRDQTSTSSRGTVPSHQYAPTRSTTGWPRRWWKDSTTARRRNCVKPSRRRATWIARAVATNHLPEVVDGIGCDGAGLAQADDYVPSQWELMRPGFDEMHEAPGRIGKHDPVAWGDPDWTRSSSRVLSFMVGSPSWAEEATERVEAGRTWLPPPPSFCPTRPSGLGGQWPTHQDLRPGLPESRS